MQDFDDKMNAATHAAFNALGLSVATNMELAYRLNDWLTENMQGVVTSDHDDSI